jgi:hypothetical protein
MSRYLPIVLLLIFVLGSAPAACQNSSELLTNKGVLGYWFPMETGDKLLKDVTELKLLREKVSLMDAKFEAKDRLIELLKFDIQVSEGIGEKWKTAFEAQIKVTQKQQESYELQLEASKKWYRSPVLWCGVGFLIASAAAIGLNFGLAEAHK